SIDSGNAVAVIDGASPAAASAAAATPAGESAAETASTRRRRLARVERAGCDCAEVVDRAREQDRVEGCVAAVPAGLELLRVELGEDPSPLVGAAEHDRVGQVLREDLVLFGELLAQALVTRVEQTPEPPDA